MLVDRPYKLHEYFVCSSKLAKEKQPSPEHFCEKSVRWKKNKKRGALLFIFR